MTPKEVAQRYVEAFNSKAMDALSALYSDDAVDHQLTEQPVAGREAIREKIAADFRRFDMLCIVENMFEDGEWAILEWSDPLGPSGCIIFHVVNDKILSQRGYMDKLSFLREHGLTCPHK